MGTYPEYAKNIQEAHVKRTLKLAMERDKIKVEEGLQSHQTELQLRDRWAERRDSSPLTWVQLV